MEIPEWTCIKVDAEIKTLCVFLVAVFCIKSNLLGCILQFKPCPKLNASRMSV